jgi:hypothetical protein
MPDPLQGSTPVQPHPGEPMNLASFGWPRWWSGGERHSMRVHELARRIDGCFEPGRDPESQAWQWGLEWAEPREIRRVVLRLAKDSPVPADLCLEYWRSNWPTIAPERRPGARRGWIGSDDPWHGTWTEALGEKMTKGDACTFTFYPIDLPELGSAAAQQLLEAEDYLARFRKALKFRLLSHAAEPPRILAIEAYSASLWQEAWVEMHLGTDDRQPRDWSGRAEAYNGAILAVRAPAPQSWAIVAADGSWQARSAGSAAILRLRVLHAACAPESPDGTLVTLRTQAHSFTFRMHDLQRGPIAIPAYNAVVARADEKSDKPIVDTAALAAQRAASPQPIYERVPREPEQSLQRAMAEIPPLDETITSPYGRYLPLSLDGGRQELAVRYNGEVFMDKAGLKLKGRDVARLTWPGQLTRFCFGSGDPPNFREGQHVTRQRLLKGWLPMVISEWLDREIEYQQTAFVAPLTGSAHPVLKLQANEDAVAILRFRLRNTTEGAKRAQLWLAVSPQEELYLRENMLLARGRVVPAEPVARQWRVQPYEAPCLRCAMQTAGDGLFSVAPYALDGEGSRSIPSALLYSIELAGGEAAELSILLPFNAYVRQSDWVAVAGLDVRAKMQETVAHWESYVGSGAQLDLPDALLADLHRAVRAHVAITADREPATGLFEVPAATWFYRACGNEACWQINMLEQAGHHDRAAAYLETYLQTQGLAALDGDFSSSEGAFQGADIDGLDELGRPRMRQSFGYNLDHGFILEALANHYRYTGDRAWLERAAPYLLAGCQFVVRERQHTRVEGPDGQPVPGWGLLPAGHLEDNHEWRQWFAVNARAFAGMRATAEVLAKIGHPEAGRLASEAEAYRQDIRRAAQRGMVETPVMRLLDGRYVPHIPTRAGLRGREWGWFREAAYGALHLLEGGVYAPEEPEMTWLLQDLEDNLFVSRQWGRPVDLEKYWFSHGGVTIQANLMDLAIDYLRRGQIEHGLRALFNNVGASLYPDVRAFTEHPVTELGHGVGPFYKTPDEAKSLVWLRAFLLHEQGERLWLAPGAPRAWYAPGQHFGVDRAATFFGPVTYRVEAGRKQVDVEIAVPRRRPPAEILLRLRRPDHAPMQEVTVNGQPHADFDPQAEAVRLVAPQGVIHICARYT